MKLKSSVPAILILLTGFAFCLQGYHPGTEDDGVYLSAIKKDLCPSLYPFNSQFFTLQLQASIFDKAVAASVRITHIPVAYACLLWQLAGIAALLTGCWLIAGYCFSSFRARFAGVLTISCLLTLPVAGTALYISDEHLHPRLLATDAILFAVAALQRGRPKSAAALLLLAFLFHPIMAMFGLSFCLLYVLVGRFQQKKKTTDQSARLRSIELRSVIALPISWLFAPTTGAWRMALSGHSYYRLGQWAWYEWLGVIFPPILLWLIARLAKSRANAPLFQIASTLVLYSVFQFGMAVAMIVPAYSVRLLPLQPMRYLHLTFLLMALLGGACLGEYLLRARIGRWLLVFLPLAAANGCAQRLRYPETRNLQLPWLAPENPWLQAFAWVRANTPRDAVFAMNPHYLSLPGEDNFSFRALAERSSLVDDEKDDAVVTEVPRLANIWLQQHDEQLGWEGWSKSDFLRLAAQTPARWVLVEPAHASGLQCPYQNAAVYVCRI